MTTQTEECLRDFWKLFQMKEKVRLPLTAGNWVSELMGSDLYTHVENMEVEGRENRAYKDNDLSTGILKVRKHPKISIDFQQVITITLLIQSPVGWLNRWSPCRSQTSAVLDHTHLVASPTAWFRAAQGRSHHNLKNGHSKTKVIIGIEGYSQYCQPPPQEIGPLLRGFWIIIPWSQSKKYWIMMGFFVSKPTFWAVQPSTWHGVGFPPTDLRVDPGWHVLSKPTGSAEAAQGPKTSRCRGLKEWWITLPKTNSSPQQSSLPTIDLQGRTVSFRECIIPLMQGLSKAPIYTSV